MAVDVMRRPWSALAAPPPPGPSVGLPSFDAVRRAGIVGRILTAIVAASIGVTPFGIQRRATAWTASFLREQRLEW
jgi:hypothetical protein